MLARLAYCYTDRTGVVFRQMCSRIIFIGPSRASVSYIAKFLVAIALRSRRDFEVLYYLSSCTCNRNLFYLRISCLFSSFSILKTIELNLVYRLCLFTLDKIYLGSLYILIELKVLTSSFRSLEPPSFRKGRVGTQQAII